LIWTFWGRRRLRILILPLLLLATMVPIPMIAYNAVSVPLKLMASGTATRIAQTLGVVVYREGNVIQLARISVGVDEACNGLASLSSLFIASLLLGLIECDRLAARILLGLLSIPLAVVVNIIRITGTAIIADYHREIALGFYHSFSGWLTFLMALAALYATAKLLNALMARFGSEL
jgi:exosortase